MTSLHRQTAISVALVGRFQAGWPGVGLPLLCLQTGVVCIWVHVPGSQRGHDVAEEGKVGACGAGDPRRLSVALSS